MVWEDSAQRTRDRTKTDGQVKVAQTKPAMIKLSVVFYNCKFGSHASSVASNPGFSFWILSHTFGEKSVGKPGFKATSSVC